MFTSIKSALIRPILSLFEHPQVKLRVTEIVKDMLDNPVVQIRLWKQTNFRPPTLLTLWALAPNDIREGMRRQATQVFRPNYRHTELDTADGNSTMDQVIALNPGQQIDDPRSGWLPYAFATDSPGTTVGAGAFTTGNVRQLQVSIFSTAFGSSNQSWEVVGSLNNFRLPSTGGRARRPGILQRTVLR